MKLISAVHRRHSLVPEGETMTESDSLYVLRWMRSHGWNGRQRHLREYQKPVRQNTGLSDEAGSVLKRVGVKSCSDHSHL